MSVSLSLLTLFTCARRRAAWVAAWVLAAQLALFAHALTHEYAPDIDHAHVVCSLCTAAHQFDHGVAPATLALAPAQPPLLAVVTRCLCLPPVRVAAFSARAPPASLPLA